MFALIEGAFAQSPTHFRAERAFNGTTLAGWHAVGQADWRVEQGQTSKQLRKVASMLKTKRLDPITRQPTEGSTESGVSPMDPPEAYAPPAVDRASLEQMHPFLSKLTEEHALLSDGLKVLEDAIVVVRETGSAAEIDRALMDFFEMFDRDFVPHSHQEERLLFPLLHDRLIADGEHSKGTSPKTAVDVMKDDHLKAIQLAAVIRNFIRVATRLPDEQSRLIVLDASLQQATDLIELLRLHIFREDNIVFASANRLIESSELDRMQ